MPPPPDRKAAVIPHTTATCPADRAAPIFYRLADGVTRHEPAAGDLAWGDLAVDEGRIIAWAPVAYGPWAPVPAGDDRCPCEPTSYVECELADGSRSVDFPDQFAWGSIVRWRECFPAPVTAHA